MVTAQLCGAAWSLEVFSSWAVGQSQQPREPHPLRGSRRWRFRGENIFSPLPFVRTSSLKALLCFGDACSWFLLVWLLVDALPSLFLPSLQPHSVIRHTIRSTNRNIRAERTASEINCEFLLCFLLFLGSDLPLVWSFPKNLLSMWWEANPGEAVCESPVVIIQNYKINVNINKLLRWISAETLRVPGFYWVFWGFMCRFDQTPTLAAPLGNLLLRSLSPPSHASQSWQVVKELRFCDFVFAFGLSCGFHICKFKHSHNEADSEVLLIWEANSGLCTQCLGLFLPAFHCSEHWKDPSARLFVLMIKLFYFVVDKLQFEPPLRKETEARDEMVRTSLEFPVFIKIVNILWFNP